jgi:hypothetical protein
MVRHVAHAENRREQVHGETEAGRDVRALGDSDEESEGEESTDSSGEESTAGEGVESIRLQKELRGSSVHGPVRS